MNAPTKKNLRKNIIPILKIAGLFALGVLFLIHSYTKYLKIIALEQQGEEVKLGWFYGFIYKYMGVYGVSTFFIIIGMFTLHKAYLALKAIKIE